MFYFRSTVCPLPNKSIRRQFWGRNTLGQSQLHKSKPGKTSSNIDLYGIITKTFHFSYYFNLLNFMTPF